MFKFPKRDNKGFTLIELLVVIAIIGILASVVLASVADARKGARNAARVQAVKQLQNALELYRNANGGYYPCPTVNCTSAGGAGAIAVNGSTRNSTFDSAMAPYYKAVNDTPTGWNYTIMYRLGSNNGASNNNPDRTRYSIALRREGNINMPGGILKSSYNCSVSMNGGHSSWAGTTENLTNATTGTTPYPPCF